jgi:hypothetical protein
LLAAWPLFALLGGDFRASGASHNFIHGAMLAFSLLFPCRILLGWRWIPTFLISAVLFRFFYDFLGNGWSSVLGFRSFLPIVVALVVLYWLPSRGKPTKNILYGALAGILVLWSNDYGIPALLVLLGILVLDRRSVADLFMAGLGAILGFLAVTTAVTYGDPAVWMMKAIIESSSIQSWYFNPDVANKTYEIQDFPWHDLSFAIAIILVIGILFMRMKWGGNPRRDATLALLLTALGGFTISCLGGTYEARYTFPLWRYVIPIVISMTAVSIFLISPKWIIERYSPFFGHSLFSSSLAATLAFLAFFVIPRPLELAPDIRMAQARGMLIEIPSFGLSSWPEVATAVETGRALAEQGRSIASAYAGPVSIGARSEQPVPPYIIHSWGSDLSRVHLLWNNPGTSVVETLDHDALAWGLWGVRMHWPLFRDLFMERRPIQRTAWSLLWERREEPLGFRDATCEIVTAKGRPEIRISASVEGRAWWADVSLDVTTEFQPSFMPIVGRTSVISLTEGEPPREGAHIRDIVAARWTAPLRDGRIEAPVILEPDSGEAILNLTAWPIHRSNMEVTGCRARLVAPYEETVRRSMRLSEVRTYSHLRLFPLDMPLEDKVMVGLLNPFMFSSIMPGDTVVLPNGSHRIVVQRDFGSFAYRREIGDTPPEPGSELIFLPTANPAFSGLRPPKNTRIIR